MADQEFRFVGGEMHGDTRVFSGTAWMAPVTDANPDKPLSEQVEIAYEQRAFGSIQDARGKLQLDVMLDVQLVRRIDRDPQDAEVAWALLDAFFADLPGAHGQRMQHHAVRRALVEAQAALKRARRALPKECHGSTEGTLAWFAENGIDRIKHALNVLDDPPPKERTDGSAVV